MNSLNEQLMKNGHNIGERVAFERKKAGLVRRQLAYDLGITHQQLGKYERGMNRISSGTLLQIANILKVPVTVFYEQEDIEKTEEELELGRMTVELMTNFGKIKCAEKRKSIAKIVRFLAA